MSRGYVGRPMEILLVEDGLLDARLAIAALRRLPFRVRLTLATDGDEAVRCLLRQAEFGEMPRPDIVLLDLVLPKVDGLEILKLIRTTEKLRAIPVVVLTASNSPEDRCRCESFRVDHFLSKPVRLDRFIELVKAFKLHWQEDIILPFAKDEHETP